MNKSFIQEQHLIATFLFVILEKNDEYVLNLKSLKAKKNAKQIESICVRTLDRLYNIPSLRNKPYLSALSEKVTKKIDELFLENKMNYLVSLSCMKKLLINMNADSKEALNLIKCINFVFDFEDEKIEHYKIDDLIIKCKTIVRHNYQIIKK